MEQAAPVAKMGALLLLGVALMLVVAPLRAQLQRDNFREIGSKHADLNKRLVCSVEGGQISAYLYFSELNHFAGFHEGDKDDGRIGGTYDATVSDSTVSWKTPGVTPSLKEEVFSLDRKTGALEADVTYPAPSRHLSMHCSEDQVFVRKTGQWVYHGNTDFLCYSGYPNGIHSKKPIRVYVVKVELSNGIDKDHPDGLHVPNAPLNKSATETFVSALNREALSQRSDTSFVAADGPEDAMLYAKLVFDNGTEPGEDHRRYYAEVEVGGMGLTSSALGPSDAPHGQRWFLVSYNMGGASEISKYDIRTPGEASQIAFAQVAKRVVKGWICPE